MSKNKWYIITMVRVRFSSILAIGCFALTSLAILLGGSALGIAMQNQPPRYRAGDFTSTWVYTPSTDIQTVFMANGTSSKQIWADPMRVLVLIASDEGMLQGTMYYKHAGKPYIFRQDLATKVAGLWREDGHGFMIDTCTTNTTDPPQLQCEYNTGQWTIRLVRNALQVVMMQSGEIGVVVRTQMGRSDEVFSFV